MKSEKTGAFITSDSNTAEKPGDSNTTATMHDTNEHKVISIRVSVSDYNTLVEASQLIRARADLGEWSTKTLVDVAESLLIGYARRAPSAEPCALDASQKCNSGGKCHQIGRECRRAIRSFAKLGPTIAQMNRDDVVMLSDSGYIGDGPILHVRVRRHMADWLDANAIKYGTKAAVYVRYLIERAMDRARHDEDATP